MFLRKLAPSDPVGQEECKEFSGHKDILAKDWYKNKHVTECRPVNHKGKFIQHELCFPTDTRGLRISPFSATR